VKKTATYIRDFTVILTVISVII